MLSPLTRIRRLKLFLDFGSHYRTANIGDPVLDAAQKFIQTLGTSLDTIAIYSGDLRWRVFDVLDTHISERSNRRHPK